MEAEHDQLRAQGHSAFRLAGRFLLPFDTRSHAGDVSWAGAGVWLPFWGLFIGIAYAAIFRLVWLWLGEYQGIRIAPMALLLTFDVTWLGYRLLAGAAGVVSSWHTPTHSAAASPAVHLLVPVVVFVAVAVVLKFALLVALPAGAVTWPADWRQNVRILYPYVIYRPLILMPLWGRWAVFMASNIGRVSPEGSERLQRLAGHGRLHLVMVWWVAITILTVLYCSPSSKHIGWPVLISLAMLVVSYLAAFVLGRRFSGQTEATVTTAGWAVEMAFLLAYLPLARYIYWY